MIGRSLPAGDLDVSTGTPQFIDGIDYCRQKIRQRLLLLRGEWFADTRKGFPLLQIVLVKNPDMQLVKSTYRREILAVPGVVALRSLDLQYDRSARTLTGNFVAVYSDGRTIDGSV